MSPLPISEASSIRVAEYLTELPPREVLERKLEGCCGDCTGTARCSGKGGIIFTYFDVTNESR
jgi:hypothetical protein